MIEKLFGLISTTRCIQLAPRYPMPWDHEFMVRDPLYAFNVSD